MDIKTLSFSPDTLTVQPDCGALVARNAATFAVAVLRLLRQGMHLEVDLSSVRHIDGAGVGALLTCRHAMQREGCTLLLPPPKFCPLIVMMVPPPVGPLFGFTSLTLMLLVPVTPSIVPSLQPLQRPFEAEHQFKLVVACARLLMRKHWLTLAWREL